MILRPLGYKVFGRWSEWSSCVYRIKVMLSNELFFVCPMIVNFAYMEKSWCARRKCCSTGNNFSEVVDFTLCL